MEKKNKILIVEDSMEFRKSLKWILEPHGFQVFEAKDSEEARLHLEKESVDLIISDLKLPHLSGIEFHQWVKENKISTPFVIMTGHGEVSNTKDAHSLGMQGFIPKPFTQDDVLETISSILNEEPSNSESLKGKYISLPINQFITERNYSFNIYIKASDQKFIKIAHRGEDLDKERLNSFIAKGIDHLYILKTDFSQFLGFNLNITKGIESSKCIPIKKKQEFVSNVGESILKYAFHEEIDSNLFSLSKAYVESAVSILLESDEIFHLLESFRKYSDALYCHSLAVSTYSVLIAKQVGWTSLGTLHKLAIGGLFHDIGKKEISKDLLGRHPSTMSHSEQKQIESHVARGVEILSRVTGISEEIIQIVHHHHETLIGTGYPQSLSENKIFPLAKIVSMANEFCNISFSKNSKVSPAEALSRLIVFENQFDHNIFLGLFKLFNLNYRAIKYKAS